MAIKIKGSVIGAYARPCNIRVYDFLTGALIASQMGVTTEYDIVVPDLRLYTCTLTPDIGGRWEPSVLYVDGSVCFPTIYENTPYYYEAVGTGFSASTEPLFTTDPVETYLDNQITWKRVERIPFPIIHNPTRAQNYVT